MEIIIDNKPWTYIRFGIGVLCIIAGVASFLAEIDDLKFLNYFLLASFILAGIINMTNEFGTTKTWIKAENNGLVIKRISRLLPVRIDDSSIDSVSLQRSCVIIRTSKGKPVKINLRTFEIHQKQMLFEFLIRYAGEKNKKLEKNF